MNDFLVMRPNARTCDRITRGSRWQRWTCPHPGCQDTRLPDARSSMERHALQVHVRCTCGRVFTAYGMLFHWAHVSRGRCQPHPPLPAKDRLPAPEYGFFNV